MSTNQHVVNLEIEELFESSGVINIIKVKTKLLWIDIIPPDNCDTFISHFISEQTLSDREAAFVLLLQDDVRACLATLGYAIFLELKIHEKNIPSAKDDLEALINYLCKKFSRKLPRDEDINQVLLNVLELCRKDVDKLVRGIIPRTNPFMEGYDQLIKNLKLLNTNVSLKRRIIETRQVPERANSSSDEDTLQYPIPRPENVSHTYVLCQLLQMLLELPQSQNISTSLSLLNPANESIVTDLNHILRFETSEANCPRVLLDRILERSPPFKNKMELALTSICGSPACSNLSPETDNVPYIYMHRPLENVCLSNLLEIADSLISNCPTCDLAGNRRLTELRTFRNTQYILLFVPVFDEEKVALKKKIFGWSSNSFLFQGKPWRAELVIFHDGNARLPNFSVAKRDGSRFIYINSGNILPRLPTDADEKTTAFLLKRVNQTSGPSTSRQSSSFS